MWISKLRKCGHIEQEYKKWYSYKLKGQGLRYLICVSLKRGDIVFIDGPYLCGEYTDAIIFESSLIPELGPYERVEADSGYSKFDPEYAKTPSNAHLRNEDSNELANTARARQETINKRLKQWGCLSQVYRHELEFHTELLRAVAVMTQLSIDNGEKLFELNY